MITINSIVYIYGIKGVVTAKSYKHVYVWFGSTGDWFETESFVEGSPSIFYERKDDEK